MRTHIELNKAHLLHNLKLFREVSGRKLMFVVKANAYGHGLAQVIAMTKDWEGIDYYAVDSLEEALVIRQAEPQKKILVLGWADDRELKDLVLNGIEMVVPSADYLKRIDEIAGECGLKARCQMKLETGTFRLGMTPETLLDVIRHRTYENIEITGIYSHFANIEDTSDHGYAREQLKRFNAFLDKIDHRRLLKHFSCSASTLLFPRTYFDIVRVGISAYGYWPSKQTLVSYLEKMNHPEPENGDFKRRKIELKPVLSWHSKVAQVKEAGRGTYISYGLTYRTFSDAKIIVVPVGYYDGYDRRLSNTANIIVKGTKAPLRGRVCMNMFMAEVTHIDGVREGDRVTLLGGENGEVISADDLAEWGGTINYEVLSRIGPHISRIIS